MSRGMPSMLALLGLLAVAGYQNRDKIAEMLDGSRGGTTPPGQQPGLGGLLGSLGGMLGGASGGSILNGGLGELLDRFKRSGQGETAESWVKTGANQPVSPQDLERAIGSDVLDTLAQRTGLSRATVLARLSQTLPDAVDKYTPDGKLPDTRETAQPI